MYKKSVNRQETSLLSQYREFFEPASEGVFFTDSVGNIIEANPYGCKMFGYRYEEICNLSIQTLISPENIHTDPIQFEILSENQTTIKERKLCRKDGSLFDAEIHGRRLPDNIILGTIRDISKQKEAQKKLYLAETRFRKFVEMANGIVFSFDQNQQITYVNPQIKSMLGYEVEEVIGKYAYEFIFSAAVEDHEIHVQNAEAHKAEVYEQRLLRKDGTMIWGLVSSTPEFDQDGNYLGAFGTIMDITGQKHQQNIQETRIHLMQFARTNSLDDLLQETLDKLCILTNSSIGFYHFLETDQKTISLQAWSTDTKKYFCYAEGEKLHYDIDEAGVWVDCIRQRKPVIHNEYATLKHKKGLPPGHAMVIRELVVPVFRDDCIVAVLGVGNKPAAYDQNDVDLVTSFADLAWDIADKKSIENILVKNENLLEKSQKMAHLGSYEIDIMQNTVVWSKETLRIFGLAENDPAPTVEEYQAFIHPEDVKELYELFDESFRTGKDFELTYRIIRGNGEIRTVYSLGKISRNNTGQITGMTGTIQDITENKRIQANLDEVNQRYQRLANNAPDIIFRYGFFPNMHLEYINPAVETITGYSPEECYADPNLMITIAHPDDVEKMVRYLKNRFPPAEPLIMRWISKDGVTHWMESRIVPIINEKDQLIAVEGITRDVSERKLAVDMLLESEKRFRQMADTAPVLIWMSGKDKLCTYFNQTWLDFTGRTFQQELGEGWAEGVHPEDFSTCLETYSTAFDSRQPFEMDYRLRSANGEYRWIIDHGIPRFSPEGEFLGYIGTGYDITERKRSEKALKRSEASLKETQQLTHLGGWEYQVAAEVLSWSDEVYQIYGLSRAQTPVSSRAFVQLALDCYPSEAYDQIKNAFNDCVLNGTPYELELPFITLQGKHKWVRTRGKPVIKDGKIIRVVGNIMDITERKLAQIKLQTSLDEKDVLIREVHHRVKNNLAAILGLLELERQTTSDPAATILIIELGNRIKSMATVHEKLYRSENLSKIDFHDYLKSFVSHLRTSLNIKNKVVSQIDAEGIELSLEYAVPCGLIVNELVTNALKHAFPNNKPGVAGEKICKITVSMQEMDGTYTLTVADNGVGLSKDIQWESSTSLGLRLFRMLGEHQLGGKITLDRTQGTQFRLVFKLRDKGSAHD